MSDHCTELEVAMALEYHAVDVFLVPHCKAGVAHRLAYNTVDSLRTGPYRNTRTKEYGEHQQRKKAKKKKGKTIISSGRRKWRKLESQI
jgi:hypothetical protein